jgi:hypothetical protein
MIAYGCVKIIIKHHEDVHIIRHGLLGHKRTKHHKPCEVPGCSRDAVNPSDTLKQDLTLTTLASLRKKSSEAQTGLCGVKHLPYVVRCTSNPAVSGIHATTFGDARVLRLSALGNTAMSMPAPPATSRHPKQIRQTRNSTAG